MKSEPGRSVVSTSTSEASSPAGAGTAAGGAGVGAANGCAAIAPALAASVAIPPAAAPFKNLRRSTKDCSGFFMAHEPPACVYLYPHSALRATKYLRRFLLARKTGAAELGGLCDVSRRKNRPLKYRSAQRIGS